tara:strand:- start:132 stop:497 length:366 start_codon:yes stop_codon:yes gene_type:complete
MGILSSIFGGGVVGSVERIASEFIQTDMESAEAKSLMIKTLDPNGLMRRDLSRFACWAYGFYLVAMVGLSFMVAFNVGDVVGAKDAAEMMVGLFLPITTSWAAIVSASFGVNAANSIKGRP